MNAAPLFVGFAALLTLAAMLVLREPSPGALATAHAEIGTGFATCATCHTPNGLDAGCLSCHDAIGDQIDSGRGFHADRRSDCASCHPDHHGASFDVMEAVAWRPGEHQSFDHGHVAFQLSDSHDDLTCRRCHRGGRTYLGLDQQCASCHDDIHGGELFGDCAKCHDQRSFKPASLFDHDRNFPLVGRHKEAACDRCHGGLDYHDVKGRECHACHDSPHRFESPKGCEECHRGADDEWIVARERYDAPRHAGTGFALAAPHAEVACAKCHKPTLDYEARFVAPPRAEAECRTCHEDVHRGQFKSACTDCHAKTHFLPVLFDRARHNDFALRGAHKKAGCRACHTEVAGTRRFVDTPRTCAACHTDPHGGQFKESCDSCHDENSFAPARYTVTRHDKYPLTGAHGGVACNSCHASAQGVRRFVGTARTCAACHDNPHGSQFSREMKAGGCAACHDTASFRKRPFDHATYALEGEHASADCARCHRRAGTPPTRVYRGTSRSCANCHRDEHRGQFAKRNCDSCHKGFREWELRRFDHSGTRFPLDATHRKISCDDCHPKVRQRDGGRVVQYRPLGHECKDCHEVDRR